MSMSMNMKTDKVIDKRIEYLQLKLNKMGYKENSIKTFVSTMNKLIKRENDINKLINEFEAEDLVACIPNTKSKMTMYRHIANINKIMEVFKMDIRITSEGIKESQKEIIEDLKSEDFFTRDEILDVCDVLMNPSDRFIFYGLFSGISGKEGLDLLTLKVDDVDLKKKRIKSYGKTINMDKYLFEIVKDTIETHIYIKKGSERQGEIYKELNMNSEYLIKTFPQKQNNNGLNHLTTNGLRSKLRVLSGVLEMETLTITNIVRSGAMHRLHQEVIKGMKLTLANIREFIQENNLDLEATEFYRVYKEKYSV